MYKLTAILSKYFLILRYFFKKKSKTKMLAGTDAALLVFFLPDCFLLTVCATLVLPCLKRKYKCTLSELATQCTRKVHKASSGVQCHAIYAVRKVGGFCMPPNG